MRSRPTPEDQNLPQPNVAYAPSIPVSVYKELAIQLQASKALSEALNAQNQQLLRQNQQLQQELNKAIESVVYWRQINNAQKTPDRSFEQTQSVDHNSSPSAYGSLPFLPKPTKIAPVISEQEQGRYRRPSPASDAKISSWSLAIAIGLIMVTAFGAGYFMMRPLVRSR
ncbi:hypothetical protein [Synechocystis sp. PCC 7509]|uniref:hypothetical protein n=1 Tax=Synechocystis sp. PCC 7509 TaxID=927677 RepID=UPI0002ACF381|nr:hypothetical protein [Synechocystis sp. PCC 7509]